MANTQAWASLFDTTTNAGFRAIFQGLHNALAAVNPTILTQTADAGQINLSTVTAPAANTSAGYEIWKFTDSQGTYYFRFDYRMGGNTSRVGIAVTIGTGTNGAGTITGVIGTATRISSPASNIQSTTTNYNSHMCCVNGGFWFLVGEGSTTTTSTFQFGMIFMRTGDSSGSVDNAGFILLMGADQAATSAQTLVYSISQGIVRFDQSNQGSFKGCYIPFSVTSTNFGTGGNNNYQISRVQIPTTPEFKVTPLMGVYVTSEGPVATTPTLAIVGATTHTYFLTGTAWQMNDLDGNARAFALVYE